MNIELILRELEQNSGNFSMRNNDIYISLENMMHFPNLIKKLKKLQSILITPYLINKDNNLIYELHYYEFEVEINNSMKSHFVNYPQGNLLSKEIIDKFKPKAFVNQRDSEFYVNAITEYFKNIQDAPLIDDRKSSILLENAKLFFQVF